MATRQRSHIGRLGEIAQVAARHGFGYLVDGRRRGNGGEGMPTARGRHLREMLDELGPTFVKFGQLLSTRPDIVPPDIIAELRALQDDVRPFPFADVERVVREELEQPIERLFLEFDEVPLASASIGQVHRAVLPNGRRVAVKVQRPQAPATIESDIQLLDQAARLVVERVHALAFVDTRELVDEFARSIRQELDYRLEGRNADTFHHNFAGHPHVSVPRVYWSYTRPRVLTLEYLEGVQVADIELEAWSLEQRRRLAYLISEAWMTMIFRHAFFHGDPHPANILVLSPERIGLVDFGLAGRLTDRDLSKLTRLFIDAINENVEVLPKRLAELGVRYPPERVRRSANQEGGQLAHTARELPYQIHDTLEQVRDGQVEIGFVHKGLDEFMHRLDVVANRLVIALVVTGGLIGSSLIGILSNASPQLLGINIISFIGFIFSGVLGIWLLWGVIRSG